MIRFFVTLCLTTSLMLTGLAMLLWVISRVIPSSGEVRYFFWDNNQSGYTVYAYDIDHRLSLRMAQGIHGREIVWLPDGILGIVTGDGIETMRLEPLLSSPRPVYYQDAQRRLCFRLSSEAHCFHVIFVDYRSMNMDDVVWFP